MARTAAAMICVWLGTALSGASMAQDWPQWRGPHLNGSAEVEGLPESWSATENVVWRLALPGPSSATPAVVGNRVFLTTVIPQTQELFALCIDATVGRELWRRPMGTGRRMGRNEMAAPSPVCDGKVVVFTVGTGLMAAFDLDGVEQWRRDLSHDYGPLTIMFGYGSSPLLHEGVLYVQVLRVPQPYRGPALEQPLDSLLLALDPATGRERWRHVRPTDAVHESHDSYATPMALRRGDRWEILVLGGDYLTAHDPADGRELWRWGFNPQKRTNWRVVPTPVASGETAIFAVARGGTLFAYQPDGEGLRLNAPLWRLDRRAPDVCTPLLYRGRLYVLDGDSGTMTCLDPDEGKIVWQHQIGQGVVFRASPSASDGKVFAVNEIGQVFVLAAGDEFRLLSRNDMGGSDVRSCVVAVQGRLFIRTSEALYCIAAPKEE